MYKYIYSARVLTKGFDLLAALHSTPHTHTMDSLRVALRRLLSMGGHLACININIPEVIKNYKLEIVTPLNPEFALTGRDNNNFIQHVVLETLPPTTSSEEDDDNKRAQIQSPV